MSYKDNFTHADDLIAHLNTIVPKIKDPQLRSKYAGFVSIAGVTVYELAIKEVFIEFSKKKHNVFGEYTKSHFNRINGRIKLDDIKKTYIEKFGSKYLNRFKRKLNIANANYFQKNLRDIKNSYSNIITWRNGYAHEGEIPSYATYQEVVSAYFDGKEIIKCLYETMYR